MIYDNSIADVGHAPVARIFREASLARIPSLHIVRDREPICQDHFLVLPTAPVRSFADLPPGSSQNTPGKVSLALGLDHWLWFEKGRAEFCTSMQTATHAHAHLVPSSAFSKNSISTLAAEAGATRFSNFPAAIESVAGEEGSYLLFGNEENDWFVVRPPSAVLSEKRVIRRYLSTRLVGQ